MSTPPTVTVAVASTVDTPVSEELTIIVHCPLPSVSPLAQVPVPVSAPMPSSDAVTVTPLAATNPLPSPMSLWTVTVKVWLSSTWLVPLVAIVICASTYVLTASPELSPVPSVSLCSD